MSNTYLIMYVALCTIYVLTRTTYQLVSIS